MIFWRHSGQYEGKQLLVSMLTSQRWVLYRCDSTEGVKKDNIDDYVD